MGYLVGDSPGIQPLVEIYRESDFLELCYQVSPVNGSQQIIIPEHHLPVPGHHEVANGLDLNSPFRGLHNRHGAIRTPVNTSPVAEDDALPTAWNKGIIREKVLSFLKEPSVNLISSGEGGVLRHQGSIYPAENHLCPGKRLLELGYRLMHGLPSISKEAGHMH